VQVFWDYQGNELFFKEKTCGPGVSIPWTGDRWSTVNYGQCCHTGSPKRTIKATLVGGSSPAVGELQEESLGILGESFTRQCGGRVGLVEKPTRCVMTRSTGRRMWWQHSVVGTTRWGLVSFYQVMAARQSIGEEETVGR
jgi:hypothetical protein